MNKTLQKVYKLTFKKKKFLESAVDQIKMINYPKYDKCEIPQISLVFIFYRAVSLAKSDVKLIKSKILYSYNWLSISIFAG